MDNNNKSNCLNCGLIQVDIWAIGSEYNAVQCTVCKLVWLNPNPSEQTLNKYYQGYYQNRVNNTDLSNNRKLMYKMEYEWLSQYVDSGKILDVGCSDGSFLEHFDTGWEKHGVEYENSSKLQETAIQKNIELNIPFNPNIAIIVPPPIGNDVNNPARITVFLLAENIIGIIIPSPILCRKNDVPWVIVLEFISNTEDLKLYPITIPSAKT